jgi:hypothetical protein
MITTAGRRAVPLGEGSPFHNGLPDGLEVVRADDSDIDGWLDVRLGRRFSLDLVIASARATHHTNRDERKAGSQRRRFHTGERLHLG